MDEVVLVVTDHHLLQAGAVHLTVLEGGPCLNVSGHSVVVMRSLVTPGSGWSQDLVCSRELVAGSGLVVIVTHLVHPVRVGRGS